MSDTVAGQPAPIAAAGPTPATARPRGLFRRYALSFAGLVGLLLLASGVVDAWFSYRETRATLAAVQQGKAESAAQRIEQFVAEIERQIGWTTHAQWAAGSADQRRFDYVRLLRQVPAITELVQLDGQGREQLKVSRLAMDVVGGGTDYASDPRFTEAQRARIWYGPVYFRKESEPYMTLAILRAGRGGGVTLAEVNLKLIWDVVTAVRAGRGGYAYVVDRDGRLIAHPDISLVLRNTDLAAAPQVAAARAAGPPSVGDPPRAELVPGFDGSRVFSAWAPIPQLGWTVFVEQPVREAFAPLIGTLVRTIVLLLLGFVVAALAAVLFARRMLSPIRALEAGAARLGAGELDHRIDIRTGDELQALADGFNEMGGRLKESYANLERKVEDRTRELSESLERQTATSEVLNVISRSTSQIQPVLDAIVATALRLCGGNHATIFLLRDGLYRAASGVGTTAEFTEFLRAHPIAPGPGTVVGRAAAERRPAYVKDAHDPASYAWTEAVRIGQYRSSLGVPLLRDGEAIGVLVVTDPAVRAFTDAQVALLASFADQAVIAIENVRLFDEVQARTRELQESLDYQTATSDVLKAISRSTFDLGAVLDALTEAAKRLCRADWAWFLHHDGERFRVGAGSLAGPIREVAEQAAAIGLDRSTVVGRAGLTRQVVHVIDALADPEYALKATLGAAGARTLLGVPLLRDGVLKGVFALGRMRVEAFAPQQIDLASQFADQAVIAIENVRLFNEVQARTRELQESLDQQTATSEILRVITGSPGELKPVFDAILDNAMRLCEAQFGVLARQRDGALHFDATINAPAAYAEYLRTHPQSLEERRTGLGRVLATKAPVLVDDAAADPAYVARAPLTVAAVELAGARSFLAVPMMSENEVIGIFFIYRREVRPFTDKQVALVAGFANQAVIAIENVRLFDEVQARTRELAQSVDELRALGEVGQTVNSTLDAPTVLETIVAKAVELSATEAGAIYVWSNRHQAFRMRASAGGDEALDAAMRRQKLGIDTPLLGDAARRREVVQAPDLREVADTSAGRLLLEAGYRALLVVPLIGPERAIGALVLRRKLPGGFPPRTIDLMRTFAAQSVVAIQNARLFGEIEEKGRQLELASQHKSQFLANMSHELRTPLNAVLGYAELMADGVYGDLSEKATGVLGRIQANGRHLLGLINDVLDLSKIESGQLTLTLDDYSLPSVVQAVIAATESLASAKGLSLGAEIQPTLPLGRGDERRLTQVLLNVVGNAIKFTDQGGVTIAAAKADGVFEIGVTDTGPGIAPEHQARIFEEFQQVDDSSTRKKGGSGLGLAISRKIVELHGGTIAVRSAPGAGSTFTIRVPMRVEAQKEIA